MKERLDKLLLNRHLYDSREQAKKAIMAGLIQVNGQVKDKAGDLVETEADITVKERESPFVSRGGLKLAKGLDVFQPEIDGKTFIDIGASTGGFTDCLLQKGAVKVYAVDVGYGQLDWKLRNDPRVVTLERTNFRYLTRETIPEPVDGTVMDVSFISIVKLMPAIKNLMKPEAIGIWLIKPQFEAGKERIGKKGVVRDKKIHEAILSEVIAGIECYGFKIKGLDFSPVQGPKGNIEFLVHVENAEADSEVEGKKNQMEELRELVNLAHEHFKKSNEQDGM